MSTLPPTLLMGYRTPLPLPDRPNCRKECIELGLNVSATENGRNENDSVVKVKNKLKQSVQHNVIFWQNTAKSL